MSGRGGSGAGDEPDRPPTPRPAGGESRSTPQMSNLLEDIANAAQAKFVRRYATKIKNSIW